MRANLHESFSNGSYNQMGSNLLKTLAVLTALTVALPLIRGDVDCNQRPPRVDPMECCPLPKFISEEMEEKCQQASGMPPRPPGNGENGPPHGHHKYHLNPCLASCFLNETGILVDNNLNEENLDLYLNEYLAETPDLIPIVKKSFVECHSKADKIFENMQKHFENKRGPSPPGHGRGPPHGNCSPKAGITMGCTMMDLVKSCPDSVWTNTDECNEWRAFVTECKPPYERENKE